MNLKLSGFYKCEAIANGIANSVIAANDRAFFDGGALDFCLGNLYATKSNRP
jgi:hypothetical protein